MRYRRVDTKGGTYFFTVNLAERNKTLLIDHIDIFRNAINQVKKTTSVYIKFHCCFTRSPACNADITKPR